MGIPEYYRELVACPADCPIVCRRGSRQKNGAINIPRGSYSEAKPGKVRAMVVLANPGNPLPEEGPFYAGLDPDALARASWHLTGKVLHGHYYSKSFETLRVELAYILEVPPADVYARVALANVVHCSTPRTITSYPDRAIRPAVDECVRRHLRREIAYWTPDTIISYSGFALRHLLRLGIPVDASIDHPAMLGANLRADVRREKVQAVKRRLAGRLR